jgi:cell division protein FtsB
VVHLQEASLRLKRRSGVALVTLLFILMGAAFLTQVVPYRQILDSRNQVQTAREQLAALESENEVLSADVASLNTPEEIERLAREKLGYVREGEVAYVVLDPPGAEASAEPVPATDDSSDRTWVEEIWDFITGSDLDSPG